MSAAPVPRFVNPRPPKSGRLDPADTWSRYPAVRVWVPALEEKPQPGWLVNDGLGCGVTWFSGFDMRGMAEVYWMELDMARSWLAEERGEPRPRPRPRGPVAEVHMETEDGVVHVFDVSEEWHVETTARERRPA